MTGRDSYLVVFKPVGVLYAAYFAFFMSVFMRSNEFAYGEYLATLSCMALMLVALISYKQQLILKEWKYLLLIFVLGFSIVLLLRSQSHYTILLYLKIMLMIFFFSVYRIARQDFITFINRTYLIYLAASILVWVGAVPNIFYVYIVSDEFYADFGLFGFNILYGIEGSPALIDTYSAFVLLVNIFLNQDAKKGLYIGLSVVGLLASFRMTPMVALFGVVLLYPVYKQSRYIATAILISISLIFLALIVGLYTEASIKIFGEETDLRLVAYAATHARSMIWVQQLEYMIDHYSLIDYIFGRYSVAEFTVPTMQIDGSDAGRETPNPHNNYLLLFFRSPFLLCLFMAIFLVAQFKSYSSKTFPAVLLIFLAAFTNSSLIGLGNPVYLFFLTYIMLEKRVNRSEPRHSLRNFSLGLERKL